MPRRIVIAGGGVAALEALVALHELTGDRVCPVLVTPATEFHFRALEIGESFGGAVAVSHDIDELVARAGGVHVRDTVASVHGDRREVQLRSGEVLGYDELVVAVGARPYPAFAHGVTFDRPAEPAAFDQLLADARNGFVDGVAIVVPDRVAWTLPAYDLALGFRRWSLARGRDLAIALYTPETTPVAAFGAGAGRTVGRVLEGAGVDLRLGVSPIVMSDVAMMAGGEWTSASRIVSLPLLAGPRLPGVPCDADGFIRTGARGCVPGVPGAWAAGDAVAGPLKQGGLAAQQADEIARAIAAGLGVEGLPAPAPRVLRGVLDGPAGPLFLEAGLERGARASIASGSPLWRPATKVATRRLGDWLARSAPPLAA